MMPCWTEICARYKHSNTALTTAQLPTFTLPNLAGIMTGEAANVHGIVGNLHYDETADEVRTISSCVTSMMMLILPHTTDGRGGR
jgi:predicted AlkP superfamily pyrophosphatase or phosphodiesterase